MSEMKSDTPLVNWVLNGREVQSPAGMTIFEAAKALEVEIPNFCYHPGLTIAGNCRICMVESNRSKKPVISCSERVAEGLEIQTESPMAVEARNAVMEFQLINHPLDCPVCDKAGECILQDYSYDHGPDRSRFDESKNIRHTKELGPTIDIWGNRCIVCTRCVRFCDEVSGTGELCVVERGDRSVVDVFPTVPIDNPLAGNVVDICPVGALISKDFKYEARIWNMEKTDSVCGGCARGCNVEVQSQDGFVKRLVPRENPQVNQWWMCDEGRYDYRYLLAEDRVTSCSLDGSEIDDDQAHRTVGEWLSQGNGTLGILVDPFITCEEAFLVDQIRKSASDAMVGGWQSKDGVAQSFPGQFTISGEKSPNRLGVEAVLGQATFGQNAKALLQALEQNKIATLLIFAGFPHPEVEDSWISAIGKSQRRATFALRGGEWTKGSGVVIPGSSPFEKDGTWANEDGILQRVRHFQGPGAVAWGHDLQRLQAMMQTAGIRTRSTSSASVFRELADQQAPFNGLGHSTIPTHGAPLPGFARQAVGAEGSSE